MTAPVKAEDVVAEALSWVKTPYLHQGRLKGIGVDCANFVSAVAANTGATPDVEFEKNYRRHEDGVQMLAELVRYLEPVAGLEDARLGDIVAFHDGKHKDVPRHLAFVTALEPYPMMAHSSEHGVRNHRINAHFKGLVHSIWRRPGLIYD